MIGVVSDALDELPPWVVVVLTGGASRRMGRDKATLDVAGVTLLDRTLADVPADVDVIVAGPPVDVARSGVRFVREQPPGGGPVAGLDAALASVSAPVAVVLATDLPLVGRLPVRLVRALVEARAASPPDAVLALDASGQPQQLCAAYRTDALRRAIADGGPPHGASMRSVIERLATTTLSADVQRGEHPDTDPTWDIDTPDDLRRLEGMLDAGTPDQPRDR